MRTLRRFAIRRAIALCMLGCIAALLALPVLAYAADNLVTAYNIPDFWMQGSNDEATSRLAGNTATLMAGAARPVSSSSP